MLANKSTLKITQVQVFPIHPADKGKLRALCRVLINDELLLSSLRVYAGTIQYFVSYPNDPHHKGEDYRQLYYPVTKDLRDNIEAAILTEFHRVIQQNGIEFADYNEAPHV
jgi:stage V sporulation protein G